MAVDAKNELPIDMIVDSANENEKKQSIGHFKKTSEHVKPGKLTRAKLTKFVAVCKFNANINWTRQSLLDKHIKSLKTNIETNAISNIAAKIICLRFNMLNQSLTLNNIS